MDAATWQAWFAREATLAAAGGDQDPTGEELAGWAVDHLARRSPRRQRHPAGPGVRALAVRSQIMYALVNLTA